MISWCGEGRSTRAIRYRDLYARQTNALYSATPPHFWLLYTCSSRLLDASSAYSSTRKPNRLCVSELLFVYLQLAVLAGLCAQERSAIYIKGDRERTR